MTILVVEDERSIREQLCAMLAENGFATDAADGQESAIELLESSSRGYDLALVDLYLQDGHGYTVCRAANEKHIPVVFMTARDDERTAENSLALGADYVQKNRPRELLSRIRGVLSKAGKMDAVLTYGALRIDTEKALAYKGDEDLELSGLEYRLLLFFMRHCGKLVTVDQLKNEIWNLARGYTAYITDETVRQNIKRLRRKIEDDMQQPQYIQTVRGMGYKFGA